MHKTVLYFLILLIFIGLFSCKKDKLKAPKASFLLVNTVSLVTTPTQGENTEKITDIWYYVNDQFKGVFPVGSVMPIVATGNADIKLLAGIKNNGISGTRIPYEFYNSKEFNLSIEEGKTYTVTPQFEYNSNAIFYYAENFDASFGGSQFSSVGDSAISNTKDFDVSQSYGGIGGSILMGMSDAKPTAKIINTAQYYIPAGGATVYLEINYKCNQKFIVGVIGGGFDERDALVINPSDDWNKIYVQLTNVVSTQPTYSGYQVFIKATKAVDNPAIYIDNIKLIAK